MVPLSRLILTAVVYTACASINVMAQIKVIENRETGVEVIPYQSPRFNDAAARWLAGGISPSIRAMLPYSVVLRNVSGSSILAMTIRYVGVESNDTPVTFNNFLQESDPAATRQHFLPNAARIHTPLIGLTNGLLSGGKLQTLTASQEADLQEEVARFRTFKSVEVSVDSVVLPSGQILGPDRSNSLDRLNEWQRAETDLMAAAVARPPVSAETLIAFIREQAGTKATGNDQYSRQMRRAVNWMESEIRASGVERFLDRARVKLAAPRLRVHR